jgi:hypothetical protein
MKPGKLFGGTGGPLWAFAGIEACANLRMRTGASRNFPTWRHGEAGGDRGRSSQACPPMPVARPTRRDPLVGLGVPMGTKVWRRRLRADPNVVSQ